MNNPKAGIHCIHPSLRATRSLEPAGDRGGVRLPALRSLPHASDDLDDYMRFHIAQERQRNYRMPSPELAA